MTTLHRTEMAVKRGKTISVEEGWKPMLKYFLYLKCIVFGLFYGKMTKDFMNRVCFHIFRNIEVFLSALLRDMIADVLYRLQIVILWVYEVP